MISTAARLKDPLFPHREIEIWLGREDLDTQLWCMFCRHGFVRVHQRVVAIVPPGMLEMTFLTLPVDYVCSSCGTIYSIRNIVG